MEGGDRELEVGVYFCFWDPFFEVEVAESLFFEGDESVDVFVEFYSIFFSASIELDGIGGVSGFLAVLLFGGDFQEDAGAGELCDLFGVEDVLWVIHVLEGFEG